MLYKTTVVVSLHSSGSILDEVLPRNQEKRKEKNEFVGAVCPYLKGAMPNTISLDQLWNAE